MRKFFVLSEKSSHKKMALRCMSVILIIAILRHKITFSRPFLIKPECNGIYYFDNLHGILCCHLKLFHYYYFSTHFAFFLYLEIHTFFLLPVPLAVIICFILLAMQHCNNNKPPHYVTRNELAIKICYSLYLRFIARFQ